MRLAAISFATLSCGILSAAAADALHPSLPDTAATSAEIEQSFRSHSGLVSPMFKELRGKIHRVFVIWNCPYSGVDLNHIFAYVRDGSVWRKFYSGGIRGAPARISVTFAADEKSLVIQGRTADDRAEVPLENVVMH